MNQQSVASKPQPVKLPAVPEVISVRKSCTADGVGLSHYILMDAAKK